MEHPQNADPVRPFDLEAAKAGAPVQVVGNTLIPMTYVAGPDSAGKYIFTLSDGRFTRPEACDVERLRMVPLAWVEGRPVYKGDVLHDAYGEKVVKAANNLPGWLLSESDVTFQANGCTWEKPKPKTKKVKLLGYFTLMGDLVWRDERNERGSGWCRVPGEGKEVEVEL